MIIGKTRKPKNMTKQAIMNKNQYKDKTEKEGGVERASRVLRNLNALGAIAFAGAAVVAPAGAVIFKTLAALNAVQAGGFEVARQVAKKRRTT